MSNKFYQYEIFIVDDSQVQLVLLEKMLKKAGFTVKAYTNGREMIKGLQSITPSLIISDIDMPDLNGFDLFKEVEKSGVDIPFFFISSNSHKSNQERAEEIGADVFFEKPFKFNMLLSVVKEMLVPEKV